MKTESLVSMTAPTIGNNSLKPDATKYDAKTEDGEVSCYWHIIPLESIPRAMEEKLSNMKSKPVSDVKVGVSCKNIFY